MRLIVAALVLLSLLPLARTAVSLSIRIKLTLRAALTTSKNAPLSRAQPASNRYAIWKRFDFMHGLNWGLPVGNGGKDPITIDVTDSLGVGVRIDPNKL